MTGNFGTIANIDTDNNGADITATAVINTALINHFDDNGWLFDDVWTFDYDPNYVATDGIITANLPILAAFNKTDFPNAIQTPYIEETIELFLASKATELEVGTARFGITEDFQNDGTDNPILENDLLMFDHILFGADYDATNVSKVEVTEIGAGKFVIAQGFDPGASAQFVLALEGEWTLQDIFDSFDNIGDYMKFGFMAGMPELDELLANGFVVDAAGETYTFVAINDMTEFELLYMGTSTANAEDIVSITTMVSYEVQKTTVYDNLGDIEDLFDYGIPVLKNTEYKVVVTYSNSSTRKGTITPENIRDGSTEAKSFLIVNFSTVDDYKTSKHIKLDNFALGMLHGNSAYSADQMSDRFFELYENIELDPEATNNANWIPVVNFFSGEFDGKDFVINNLIVDQGSNSNIDSHKYIGLFGGLSGGTVKNLGITNVNITADNSIDCAGGIVGQINNDGLIENCYVTGSITGEVYASHVGGIAGLVQNSGTITDCYTTCDMNGGSAIAGGIVGGVHDNGLITNCHSEGDISGNYVVGGIAGEKNHASVIECYSEGEISGQLNSGGIVGTNNGGNIEDCYSTGNVKGKYRIGGVVGLNGSGDSPINTIKNCHSTGNVSGEYEIGGIVGYFSYMGLIEGCYSEGDISGSSTHEINYSDVGGIAGATYSNYTDLIIIRNCYSKGNISGIGNCVGGIAGQNMRSAIENCYHITGSVSGDHTVGGIVGNNNTDATITKCYNTGDVSGEQTVGGIAGFINARSIIENCYNAGDVNGNGGSYGGIAGSADGNGTGSVIKNCYNTGNISSESDNGWLGGIVGLAGGTVENCYSTGNISGNSGSMGSFGGIGGSVSGTIKNCYALNSSIMDSGNGYTIGRIAGRLLTTFLLEDNYALASLTASGTKGTSEKEGADISENDAKVQTDNGHYATINGWDFSDVWSWNYSGDIYTVGNEVNLPILAAFNNTDFPNAVQNPHITKIIYSPMLASTAIQLAVGEDRYNETEDFRTASANNPIFYNDALMLDYILFAEDFTRDNVESIDLYKNDVLLNSFDDNFVNIFKYGIPVYEDGSYKLIINYTDATPTEEIGPFNAANIRNGSADGKERFIDVAELFSDADFDITQSLILIVMEGDVSSENFMDAIANATPDTGLVFLYYSDPIAEITNGVTVAKSGLHTVILAKPGFNLKTEDPDLEFLEFRTVWAPGNSRAYLIVDYTTVTEYKNAKHIDIADFTIAILDGNSIHDYKYITDKDFFVFEDIDMTPMGTLIRPLGPSFIRVIFEWYSEVLGTPVNSEEEFLEIFYSLSEERQEEIIKMLEKGAELPAYLFEKRGYSGTFNGGGNTITNLKMDDGSGGADGGFGLFATILPGGVVRNLNIEDAVISGRSGNGAIAGENDGTIENCFVTADIDGGENSGGIAGKNCGTIRKCGVGGSISGNRAVGGIAGSNRADENDDSTLKIGRIESCFVTADITGNDNYIGGITGENNGVIENCYTTGNMGCGGGYCGHIGGIAGTNNSGAYGNEEPYTYYTGTIRNCYTTSAVTGNGIAGYNSGGLIEHCSALNRSITGIRIAVNGEHYTNSILNNNYALESLPTNSRKGWDEMSGEDVSFERATDNVFHGGFSYEFDFNKIWYFEDNYPGYTVGAEANLPILRIFPDKQQNPHIEKEFEFEGEGNERYMLVRDWKELAFINKNLAGSYKLMNDLDQFSDYYETDEGGWHETEGWKPLGPSEGADTKTTQAFIGTFDGNDHSIKDLWINRPGNYSAQGLFGCVDGSNSTFVTHSGDEAIIKNLGVATKAGKSITGGGNSGSSSNGVGGIVGACNNSIIENCFSACDLSATVGRFAGARLGGIAGTTRNICKIRSCYNTGSITGLAVSDEYSSDGVIAGGIVGYTRDFGCDVENCYNTGDITGTGDKGTITVGGIVGAKGGYSGGGTGAWIFWCYNTGAIAATGTSSTRNAGGIMGGGNYQGYPNVNSCYALNASITGNTVGRIVGYPYYTTSMYDNYAINTMLLNGSLVTTGLHNNKDGADIDFATATDPNATKYKINWRFDEIWTTRGDVDYDLYETGTKNNLPILRIFPDVEQNPFIERPEYAGEYKLIYDWADLAAINTNTTTLNGKYKLANNLDENNAEYQTSTGGWHATEGWTPLGNSILRFTGTFDGAGFEIRDLWINRSSKEHIGLFGYSTGNILNIGIVIADGKSISGYSNVGGIAGTCYNGSITNCYSEGNISSSGIGIGSVGGITGANCFSSITNCYSKGNMSGESLIGGIAGSCYNGSISNCYSMGNITSSGNEIGGIVGQSNVGTITNCYSVGNITGDYYVGGIVGYNYGSITYCYATGAVKSYNSYSGGIAGMQISTIQNCYALNSSITAPFYAERIAGINYIILSDNYALESLPANGTKGLTEIDGADISFNDATATTMAHFIGNGWDTDVWTRTYTNGTNGVGLDANLPILKTVGGTQNPYLP